SGSIWIGTNGGGLDQFSPDSARWVHHISDPKNPHSLSDNRVHAIWEDNRGALWVGTANGLNRLDRETNIWQRFLHDPDDARTLSDNQVLALYGNGEGTLWVSTMKGLDRLNVARPRKFVHLITGEKTQSLGIDHEQNLWVGSHRGVNRIHPQSTDKEGSDLLYRPVSGDPQSLSGTPVTAILEDRSGVLWLGTGGSGVNQLNLTNKPFRHYRHIPGNPNSLSHHSVRGIYEDRAGILWVGGYNGLNRIDRRTGRFTHYGTAHTEFTPHTDQYVFHTNLSPNVYAITGDPEHDDLLWIGSEGQGLYLFDKTTEKIRPSFPCSNGQEQKIDHHWSGDFIFDLYLGRDRILWLGTEKGVTALNLTTGAVTRYHHDPRDSSSISGNEVRTIIEDHNGTLWLGTARNGLNRFDRKTGRFTHFRHDPEQMATLSNDRITALFEDHNWRLWVGTNGGGLNRFDPQTHTFKRYSVEDGLPSDVIDGILEDNHGRLWLSTNWGLSCFDPESETFKNYDINDGLQGNEFNTAAAFKNPEGEMFFGGINGLTAFFPDEIKANSYRPPVVITGFRIANRPVAVGKTVNDHIPLTRHIAYTDLLALTYRDYVFSFEFAALSYAAPEKNRYAYKLEGFDRDWLYTDANKRFATYTALPAGEYVFRVKASNNDGIWNSTGTSLLVRISPPPWKTWWAYTLYLLAAGVSLGGILRFRARQDRLKNQLRLEHMEAEKLQELDQMKSQFFANISHEFRTPITLLSGPLEDLLDGDVAYDTPAVKQKLRLALRHARRLQKLIDQLLDLSKLEAGKLHLRVRRNDLVSFLRRVVDTFTLLGEKNHITLTLETDCPRLELYYDPEKLEKVMNNLLFNAVKFTPNGGKVTVVLRDAGGESNDRGAGRFITIQVTDTGPGIPPESLSRIFDRFYQVDSSATRKYEGTGIGLALVKEFVELHGGEVSVESRVGAGTTFTVTLPKGNAHLDGEALADESGADRPVDGDFGTDETEVEAAVSDASSLPKDTGTVLIVEDNSDMRAYLREHLSPPYRVEEAADGKEGLEKARSLLPDLIISDIMMPRMDGIELCRAIREDDVLRNVPFILLTAKAGEENRLQGLTVRANDYITKPFSSRELKLKIHNLIELRKQLMQEFMRKIVTWQTEAMDLDSVDRAFLEQIRNVVEEHVSDQRFTVEVLARKVFLSRRQLYRKLKDITGLKPTDFIRQIRLLRAKQLLEERAMSTVAEVARAVGFTKVGYFSLLFRNTFGQSPRDLIRRQESPLS
ncbi:MAG: response regulator, partial [Candidatus Neomarinimicrobiota bacterium]